MGDVHGYDILFARLIEKIKNKYPDIELWSAGDLVDRGPNSKAVIDIAIENNVSAVYGNHELWLLFLIKEGLFFDYALSRAMSGAATIRSYGVRTDTSYEQIGVELYQAIPDAHKDYLLSMKRYAKLKAGDEQYWLSHTGFTGPFPGQKLTDENVIKRMIAERGEDLMWRAPRFRGKNDNLFHFENGTQIFGHSYTKEPIIRDHFIAIDTIGAAKEHIKTLSAIILPEREVMQVKG